MPKNSTKNARAQHYIQKMQALRPFVSFDYDLRKPLSRGAKSKITRYFNELQRLTQNKPYGVQVYRPRKRDRVQKVADIAGQDTSLRQFTAVFIPKTAKSQKVTFDKEGNPRLKTQNVTSTFIPFEKEKIIVDNFEQMEGYIKELLKNRHEDVFAVRAGDVFEVHPTATKNRLPSEVWRLAQKYSDPAQNNYYGNWLAGVNAYSFDKQKQLDEYRTARREASLKKTRQQARRESERRQIKMYRWYQPEFDNVTITKTADKPTPQSYLITLKQFNRFMRTGTI